MPISDEILQEYVVMTHPDFMDFHVKAANGAAAAELVKTAFDNLHTENIISVEYKLTKVKVVPIEEEYPLNREK